MLTYTDKQKIGRGRALAKREVAAGEELRQKLRRRTRPNSATRIEELEAQVERLSEANRALRPYVARLQWSQFGFTPRDEQRLRESSKAVIRERRKLRKMLGR